jgi:hypothetical protein
VIPRSHIPHLARSEKILAAPILLAGRRAHVPNIALLCAGMVSIPPKFLLHTSIPHELAFLDTNNRYKDELLILIFSELRQLAIANHVNLWGLLDEAAKIAGPTTTGDALCQKLNKRRKEILQKDAASGENVSVPLRNMLCSVLILQGPLQRSFHWYASETCFKPWHIVFEHHYSSQEGGTIHDSRA